ncbi:Hypothetical protein AT6N2_L1200 [Agrobacterium tumefaciens]|nr:Hypothetical protein AT6N2_L1200 [Agrobacterium tumefaciens]
MLFGNVGANDLAVVDAAFLALFGRVASIFCGPVIVCFDLDDAAIYADCLQILNCASCAFFVFKKSSNDGHDLSSFGSRLEVNRGRALSFLHIGDHALLSRGGLSAGTHGRKQS